MSKCIHLFRNFITKELRIKNQEYNTVAKVDYPAKGSNPHFHRKVDHSFEKVGNLSIFSMI
jgi:hypothetical protein